MSSRLLPLLLITLLLTACGAAGPAAAPAPSSAGTPAPPAPTGTSPTPGPAPQPASRPEPPSSGLRNVALYLPTPGLSKRPKPLYDANPDDRPALSRIAAMLNQAQWSPDPQITFFPVARPHGGIRLTVIRADGSAVHADEAYRCPRPQDTNGCQRAEQYLMIDGQPALAPALAQYMYHGGWQSDMPMVDSLTLTDPTPHPDGSAVPVKPGQAVAAHGEGVMENPMPLLLQADGQQQPLVLATLPVPVGSWSWQGKLPADLAPGYYNLCAGNGGECARFEVVAP